MALTDAIVERGAPATVAHPREVMFQVYRWAIERGQQVENPAELTVAHLKSIVMFLEDI